MKNIEIGIYCFSVIYKESTTLNIFRFTHEYFEKT